MYIPLDMIATLTFLCSFDIGIMFRITVKL